MRIVKADPVRNLISSEICPPQKLHRLLHAHIRQIFNKVHPCLFLEERAQIPRAYPDLIRREHVHILQTPLFRVRNKKETRYCYSIEEKEAAIKALKTGVEITRFKGLGEISSDEFVDFIGEGMRLDPVKLSDEESIEKIMEFYMGTNTIERQRFITGNLKTEKELEDVNF